MADAADSPATHAVSLKLSPFWTARPQLWFAQADAQFALRGITTELTRFYHVVAALDSSTASRVEDIITAPPADAYSSIKTRLVSIFGLTDRERAARVLDAGTVGDRSPSAFMNELLQLVAGRNTDFIVREIFLRALPQDVATVLASSTSNLRDLAVEADHNFASTGARLHSPHSTAIHAVHLESSPMQGEVNTTVRRRGTSRHQHSPVDARPPGLCFYHAKFGSAAFRCRAPCTYASPAPRDSNQRQGNANAGGQQ